MGEIKPFLSSCTFIVDHIFSCTFFIILILVGVDKKENQFGNNLEWFHSVVMKIHKKLQKKSQNLLKVLPKTVLFRNIALIFSLEKQCYLENRVVREPCKQRSACTRKKAPNPNFYYIYMHSFAKVNLFLIRIRSKLISGAY